jgi:hypothetical protein
MKINTKKLNRARELRGLNIDEAAQLAGLSYWKAYSTFQGRSAAPRVVLALCKVVGIRMEDVVEGTR